MAKKTIKKKLTAQESRAQVAAIRKDAAIEASKEFHDERMMEADVAYDDSGLAESTAWNDLSAKELKSDWENLRRIAKVTFAEGIEHRGLSPQNRLVAIAHCLGWGPQKVSKASGIARATIYDWLRRPDIMAFMDDFNMKEGVKDPGKLVTINAINGLKVIKSILEDKDNSDSSKRLKLSAALSSIERKFGKPNQPVEHKGEGIATLIRAMAQMEPVTLSKDAEKALFEKPDSKEIH